MRERGSALLTAVVAVMVLLLISGILFSFVKNQFKMQTGEEKALKAYYLAEAGASYGVAFSNAYVLSHEINEGEEILPLPPPVSNPFGSDYGGYFQVETLLVSGKYTISDPDPDPDPTKIVTITVYIITATCNGYYPSEADPNHILRKIKKDYAFTRRTTTDIPTPIPDI